MKAICNQLENIIREKLASLENGIEIRTENINKHSHNRGTSHVSVNLGFDGPGEKRRLSWISCGLQFDIRHQFTIIFSRYISDEYYVKVE